MDNQKENKKSEPLMYIQTIQKINEKNNSQKYYDSRNKKKKEEYPSG